MIKIFKIQKDIKISTKSFFKEGVCHKLLSAWSSPLILIETQTQKLPETFYALYPYSWCSFQFRQWRLISCHWNKCLDCTLPWKWTFQGGHVEDTASQWPDVRLVWIGSFLNYFRSHIIRRTSKSSLNYAIIICLLWNSKITYFEIIFILSQQNITRLQVSMDYFVLMKIIQSLKNLSCKLLQLHETLTVVLLL